MSSGGELTREDILEEIQTIAYEKWTTGEWAQNVDVIDEDTALVEICGSMTAVDDLIGALEERLDVSIDRTGLPDSLNADYLMSALIDAFVMRPLDDPVEALPGHDPYDSAEDVPDDEEEE